jgi:DedD protein
MMERALKERIIGAAVLVLIVVLVVPVFLDGPPDDTEIVSERVLLPGQEGQATQTIVLDRDRSEPVPAASGQVRVPPPVVEKPAPQQAQEQQAPAPEKAQTSARTEPESSKTTPASSSPVSSSPVSTTGMWAVQLGSFSNKDNAERLAAELRKQGYAAFLSKLDTDSGELHRVRIGPQKDRESAEAMAERLLKVGHKGQVVPHP